MALQYVTLTADLFDGSGNLLNGGTATFTPSVQLTDATDHEIITLAPVTVSFKVTGSPTVKLLATDNGNALPTGWAWTVTFSGVSGSPASFSFFLKFSDGAAQNLSAISPVSTAVTQYPLNPMTTLGDIIYEDATPVPARLAGNTTATRKFLRQLGTGTVSAAPAWDTVQAGDLPAGTTSAQGALQLDGTAGDIQGVGAAAAAGASGLAADAKHVHTGLSVVAATAVAGYTLVNGTGNIITWTAPADGKMHRFIVLGQQIVTSSQTGGELAISFTGMDGNAYVQQFSATSLAAGIYGPNEFFFAQTVIPSGSTVTLSQFTALTAGAAKFWAEIWAL